MRLRTEIVAVWVALASLLGILAVVPAQAAPGDLDPSFGIGGKVVTDLGSEGWIGNAEAAIGIAVYPPDSSQNGKIVATGYTRASDGSLNFAVARYNPDGSLDTTFGSGGIVVTDFGHMSVARDVIIQGDDRIVAAGSILLSGSGPPTRNDFALARYTSDGQLDPTFGGDGMVTTDFASSSMDDAGSLDLQGDGKIVVAGRSSTQFGIARYNSDGSLDSGFGSGGKVTTDFPVSAGASGVAIQDDGNIVAIGVTVHGSSSDSNWALVRYLPNGLPDPRFGVAGKVVTDMGSIWDVATDVAIDGEGRIVGAGWSYGPGAGSGSEVKFALARYTTNGILDIGFGELGTVLSDIGPGNDHIHGLAVQPDGKMVVAGCTDCFSSSNGTDFALARYDLDGNLDPSFGAAGIVMTDFASSYDAAADVAIQPDGRIVTAGVTGNDWGLARYGDPPTLPDAPGDLAISNVDAPDPVSRGQELTYTITVENLGSTTVTGVTITDTFSASEVRFLRASDGCVKNGNQVTCSIGALDGRSSAIVTITFAPKHSGVITNTANVGAAEPDPQPANNSATATTQVS